MTKEVAVKLAESKWWEGLDSKTIVGFQLFERKLCMDFSSFLKALEEVLDRPVFTHELGSMNYDGICKEFLGEKPKPTMREIIQLIPEEKRIIVGL